MTYLLDTNSCVEYLRRGDATPVGQRIGAIPPASIFLSSVVVAELLYGACRSNDPPTVATQVRQFCGRFASLPFDDDAAERCATLRAHLAALGTPIGPNDLMIAATALARGLTLVTHNTREFIRVPSLTLEDWLLP